MNVLEGTGSHTPVNAYLEVGTHDVKVQILADGVGATCPVQFTGNRAVLHVPPNLAIWQTASSNLAVLFACVKKLKPIDRIVILTDEKIEPLTIVQ